MCGRFVQSVEEANWQALLGAQGAAPSASPPRRFNVAPTQGVVGLRQTNGAVAQASFGFGMQAGPRGLVINARAETVTERPMFRGLLAANRVLVMASAFYEWAPAPASSRKKVPCCFARADGKPFWLAALVRAQDPMDGCVLLTTEANDTVAPAHHRMPVMLDDADAHAWLQAQTPVARALQTLVPYAGKMRGWAVGLQVNRPQHDEAECIAPVGEVPRPVSP